MTLNASGSAGAVNPISMGGGGRRLPPWVWLVVLAVIALHVSALLILARLGVIRVPQVTDDGPPPITVYRPAPPPPAPAHPLVHHMPTIRLRPPAGPVPPTVDPIPLRPTPGPATATAGPTTLAPQPLAPIDTRPEPPKGPPVIGQPRWISQPTAEQMSVAYPQAAYDGNVEGRALLRCSVTAAGTVAACVVVSETPRGYGFGQAAQRLSRYFRMTPRTEDGRPVEGAKVDIPLQFKL
jgi:protein TonB